MAGTGTTQRALEKKMNTTIKNRSLLIAAAALLSATFDLVSTAGENNVPIIRNASFDSVQDQAPAEWETWTPRAEIAPEFGVERKTPRTGAAAGRIQCHSVEQIGAWRQQCTGIEGSSTYRFTGYFQTQNVASTQESVSVKLAWLDVSGREVAKDFVTRFTPEGQWVRAEGEIPAPANAVAVRVELGLQWCAGAVSWDDVCLKRCAPSAPRTVRVSTVRFMPATPSTLEQNLKFFGEKIDLAGSERADIVCLGETINYVSTGRVKSESAESIPGPSTVALGEAARRNRLWVVTSLYKRDGKRVYNTAVLIDRQGKLVGPYRKTHLPEAEVLGGVSPGSDYPVFQTDFGTIGMQICYDNFFPEVARSLALQGAEIIFTPIWGDLREGSYNWDIVVRARAIDNSVHFVASMDGERSLIIDPVGRILADTQDRQALVTAEINLDARHQTPWLSVGSTGEWKRMFPKERRPGTYGTLTKEPHTP